MSTHRSSSHAARALLVAALCALPLTAAAQPAPPNDVCSLAEVIPAAGPFPYVTAVADITNATLTNDPVSTCVTAANHQRGIWYRFTPAQTGSYTFSTCQDQTHTTVPDTVMGIFTSSVPGEDPSACGGTMTQLDPTAGGCNDEGCVSTGSQSVSTTTLQAGTTYYVLVYRWGTGTTTVGQTNVQLRVRHNGAPADVCGTSEELTLDVPLRGTTVNAQHDYNLTGMAACFTGVGQSTSTALGRDAVYRFTAPSAGRYSFRIHRNQGRDANLALYVANSCPTSGGTVGACVGAANRTTTSAWAEEVSCLQMNAGETFYAFADETAVTVGATYDVEVNRCNLESEPNGLVAQAGPLSCGVTGSINPAGDIDFFDLGVGASGYRLFAMIDGSASSNTNFDMRVTTATTTIEYDDADADTPFGASAPVIAGAMLNGQQVFLRVNQNSSTVAAEPYRLYSVVRSPLAAATPEVEPNDTLANATAGSTYFYGTLSGAAPSTDTDFYAFNATAGDLAFIALDGDPTRDNSMLNAALALLDAQGRMLVQVNDAATSGSTTAGTTLTSTSPNYLSEGMVFRIPTTGTYYVRVRSGSATSNTAVHAGDYLLSIALNCRSPLTPPTLGSVSPASGSSAGGTQITLTGQNFLGPVAVRVGQALATNVTLVNPTTITATVPAGTAGTATVTVFNADAQRSQISSAFTYVPPPAITSLSPNAVPMGGGAEVTINGSNFQSGATVSVAGVSAAVVSQTATQIVIVAPGGAAGPATLTVTNPDGVSGNATLTYLPPPTVTAISPASGRTSGATNVTITGTGFLAGAQVRIGGVAATVSAVTATSITATTGAGTMGPATVRVTNTDGQSGELVDGFTYVPPPLLTLISPVQGDSDGGIPVTITGQHFQPGAMVTFDSVPATEVTFVSSTELVAVNPGHAPGLVSVGVFNPDGQSDVVADAFTYVSSRPPPVVTAITPNSGTTAGGTTVVITGTGFLPGITVTIGVQPAASLSYDSETQLTVVTPPRGFGAVDVRLRNTDNQFVVVPSGFTYVHPTPVLTALNPTSGRTAGGQAMTITGSHFLTGAQVRFDGVTVPSTVTNATTITLNTPARPGGTMNVTLTNPDTQVSNALPFTFVPPPALTAVSPANGSTLGGGTFTLTGSAFLPGATVTFGGTAATIVNLTATEITGTLPARAAGAVSVTVTNPDGQLATLANAFTFINPPLLASISPTIGTTLGTTLVRLTGSQFVSGATVSFGGVPATTVTFVSATQLTALAPVQAAGTVDVRVQNPDGQHATLASAFTYFARPSVTAVSPSSGPTAGGTELTLTGADFRPGVRVIFDGMVTVPTQVTSTELVVTSPPRPAGASNIIVRNSDGQQSTLSGAYTFVPPPSITSVLPPYGPTSGGTLVTIGGADFQSGATVTIGDLEAELISASPTRLEVRSPAGLAEGQLPVEVINADGQQTRAVKAFRAVPAPIVQSVTPATGPTAGGTRITLTGSHFVRGARVFVGGVPATGVVFNGDTRLTAVTPAGTPGAAALRVVNPDGVDHTLAEAFTFVAPPVAITRVSGGEGSALGGTPLLITGAHFTAGTTVTFGTAAATAVEVVNGEVISVLTPAHAEGTVDVRVSRPDGSNASLAMAFRYLPAPIAPDAGVDPGADAGVDAGTDAGTGTEPPPTGGCSQTGGSFYGLGLLALGLMLSRRRLGLTA